MHRSPSPRLSHLQRLTDSRGIVPAAIGDSPDRSCGYRAVDQADALRLCALASGTVVGDEAGRLAGIYFNCLTRARLEDSRVQHACDAAGSWSSSGDDALVQSRLARALAKVTVSELPIRLRLAAAHWWRDLLQHAAGARTPISAGNWLIAIGQLRAADPGKDLDRARALANWLLEDCYYTIRSTDWEWFEPEWSPGAAAAATGLWYASSMFEEPRYAAVAGITTDFVTDHVFEHGTLMPVGTRGGWQRQASKALYDQLPAEACSLVELFGTVARITESEVHRSLAENAAGWFTGDNVCGRSLIDADTGGCADAIRAAGPDRNQGAAAIISYLVTESVIHQPTTAPEDASVYCSIG